MRFLTQIVTDMFCFPAHNTFANAKSKPAHSRKSYVKECKKSMAKSVVPEAREGLNRFKMEAANDLGVPLPS